MPNDENTGLTQEEVKTLEALQGNEYTAEYFFIQLKKRPEYVKILSERVQAERKLINNNQKSDDKETSLDFNLELEKIKISEISLKSVLNYMSLALIDMSSFDISKAPDSFNYQNMEQIIDLLTEKFRLYFFPDELRVIKYIEDTSKKPDYLYLARDRINNVIISKALPISQEFDVDEKSKKDKRKHEVKSILTFDIDSAMQDTSLNECKVLITEFDKQVMNAIITLRRAGNVIITQLQIYQVITHSTTSKLSETWKNAIDESITKLNSILITADFSYALTYYPELKDIEQIAKKTRLLQIEKTTVIHRNGTKSIAYETLKDPILYTIAEAKNQIATIPLQGLTNTKIKNSIDNSLLFNLLLERITGMKHEKNPLDKTIVLESIYEKLSITTGKKQRDTREKIDKILLQFQADKRIKNYECVYEKKKITKYNIYV